MELLNRLAYLEPTLVWGLVSRGIGLVFFISLASLSFQVLPHAGARGITPVRESLAAISEHFPTWKRFVYFPTLLWFNRSDAFLRALPWIGMLAALAIMIGGPQAPYMFAICYLVYLSLDRPMVLVYPWDCLLFEAAFWGMFLPATELLPSVLATQAPLPAVAWVFRLLVFRVMFGFGKHKFVGTTPLDKGFLKSFFINQPLPTPLGWLAAKLPLPVQKLSLAIMFLVEIPLPCLVFWPGPYCALAAVATLLLMVNIWLTGNFGYFNIAMIALTVTWFDSETALALNLHDFFSKDGPQAIHVLVFFHCLFALISLPLNTFCAQVWMLWPLWRRVRPAFLTWPVTWIRALHPLRWVHAYGVFPPQTPPPVKILPLIEATWDGEHWETLAHFYSPTHETTVPRFCAPHQNRFDQAVVYEGLGLNEASIMRNMLGRFDPYGYGGIPGPLMLLRRIVEGDVPGNGLYNRELERRLGPPQATRARTYMFEASEISEMRQAGRWWRRTLVGPHFPPVRRGEGFWDHPLPPPELWHFDDVVWIRRSHLGSLLERAARGADPHELVLHAAGDLTRQEVDEFWNDFVPGISQRDRSSWTRIRQVVDELRARYGREKLYRFERLTGRYALLLFARLEPLILDAGLKPIFGKGRATLDVKTSYHLRLLCQQILAEGRETYDSVVREPERAVSHAEQLSIAAGHYFQAVFRYEAFVYQSQKARLLAAYAQHQGRPVPDAKERERLARIEGIARRVFGPIEIIDFLKEQFKSDEDRLDNPEDWPHFRLLASGQVLRVPPPASVKEAET
ncbi:MAG TPA: lipase maturation factor family protein [Polyangiaceae bacterium]|nr:lipase maturation factor family protein [Polyangiaceae bacterium]